MLLVELCADFVASNPSIRSPHTQRLLLTSIGHFGRFLKRSAAVRDFTDKRLAGYVQHRRELGKADATIEREAAKLMTLWRYAASRGLCAPPTIRLAKARIDTPVAFLRGEVCRLFRAAKNYDSPIRGVPGRLVLTALLCVIWDTAERIGALCEVDRADINLDGCWITIRSRKNGGRTMVRKLRRSTAKAVGALLANNSHRKPFGYVHRGTLYYHLKRLLVKAGLPADRRHKFHCLRKSHASYLHAAGGDARESLDHCSEEITRARYYDLRITRPRDAIRFLFDPLSPFSRLLAWLGW
ncbi:MAG: site-specific integrase [Verrucomicrobiales bacterium]|nr:site-specific integrase [Verrucomicrobiales bacterium]